MTDTNNYPIWPGWETVRLIGCGSFGAVYEIQRVIFGDTEKAALKVISIPQNPGDVEEMISDGYDSESITDTFNGQLRSIVAEYSMMRKMNGSANVVNCDDVRYIQHENGLGWDIFIKMELLTPLVKALPETTDDGLAQRIAVDICHALVLCKKYDIVHRDIKPQNIFLSDNGDYKLGDFGIAKTVERTTGGTKIGTYKYMAPEVYNNQPYGSGADIYSLGLVLYWLLNDRRMPFIPLPPQKIKAGDEENARLRRFAGEPIPTPKNGSEELKRIVLKACAYDVNNRYKTADEMLADLEALGGTKLASGVSYAPAQAPAQASAPPEDNADKTVGVWSTSEKAMPGQEDADKTVGVWGTSQKTESAAEETDETLGVWDTSEKSTTASKDDDETIGVWDKPKTDPTSAENAPASPAPKKKKKGLLISLIAAVLAVAAVCFFLMPAVKNGLGKISNRALIARKYSVGDHVFLGTFEQDGNIANGPEDIEWVVLQVTDSDALLVSAKILYGMPYSSNELEHRWDLSYVRNWLNTEFLNTAFTDEIINQITATKRENSPFADTYDKVFCLSAEETGLFFQSDSSRKAVPTAYAIEATELYHADADAEWLCSSYWTTTESGISQYIVYDNGANRAQKSPEWPSGIRPAFRLSRNGSIEESTRTGFNIVAAGYYEGLDWENITDVCMGSWHVLGLKTDGTVVSRDLNSSYAGDAGSVGNWSNIVKLAAGNGFSVGLMRDGTAVSAGSYDTFEIDVSSWSGLKDIYANEGHAVGLKWDGTVVATGWNGHGQCDVSSWSEISAIAVGTDFTAGLTYDGTVVSTDKRYDVADWTNICEIAAGGHFIIAREQDGTVHLAYRDEYGKFDVSDWGSVKQIAAGYYGALALTENGNVLGEGIGIEKDGNGEIFAAVQGDNNPAFSTDNWTNIIEIATTGWESVGLRADGTVAVTSVEDEYYIGHKAICSLWNNIRKVYVGNGGVIALQYPG